MLETVSFEPRGTVDDRSDLRRRSIDGTGDDLIRGMVAPEGIDGDPEAHPRYGAGVPSG